jgi:hypothetical protein
MGTIQMGWLPIKTATGQALLNISFISAIEFIEPDNRLEITCGPKVFKSAGDPQDDLELLKLFDIVGSNSELSNIKSPDFNWVEEFDEK